MTAVAAAAVYGFQSGFDSRVCVSACLCVCYGYWAAERATISRMVVMLSNGN